MKYSYLSAYPFGAGMHTGALKVTIYAVFTVPAKWTVEKKKLARRNEIAPENKPDCDNIAKAILDALNGVAYKDDSQVAELVVKNGLGRKHFAPAGLKA